METNNKITDSEIRTLRAEAGRAGDTMMEAICVKVEFSMEAARVMVGGDPAVEAGRNLVAYYVSRPCHNGGGGTLVSDVASARTRERGYDRQARRWFGGGYDAHIVPVYADGSASGPWAPEAEAHVTSMSSRARARWGIAS